MRLLKALSVIILLFAGFKQASAQSHHEFLVKLNYTNLNYTRYDSFPGVAWVGDNTAYDANNKRFFFLGNDYSFSGPWKLFTVNSINGTIIYQQPCPGNLSSGYTICCMQYDNTCDTLYAICYAGPFFFSAWIDPATGNVNVKQSLGAVSGYTPGISAYDENHHRLLFEGSTSSGTKLIVVDAVTGAQIAASSFSPSSAVCYLEYNNTDDRLYGIGTGSPVRFDSISVMTGVQHFIGALPAMGLYQNGISAIDEANNRFIFCAHLQSGADSLLTLDLQTGAILSQQYYPYANSSLPSAENIIFYCFDQPAGLLYALNWAITVDPDGIYSPENSGAFSFNYDPESVSATIGLDHLPGKITVELYTASGKLVLQRSETSPGNMRIPLESFSAGAYFITVKCDNKIAGTRKFIISR